MRLIDADALKDALEIYTEWENALYVERVIDKTPTVSGWTCESCQKWDHTDGVGVSARKCEEWGRITSKREFCSRWKDVRK